MGTEGGSDPASDGAAPSGTLSRDQSITTLRPPARVSRTPPETGRDHDPCTDDGHKEDQTADELRGPAEHPQGGTCREGENQKRKSADDVVVGVGPAEPLQPFGAEAASGEYLAAGVRDRQISHDLGDAYGKNEEWLGPAM